MLIEANVLATYYAATGVIVWLGFYACNSCCILVCQYLLCSCAYCTFSWVIALLRRN